MAKTNLKALPKDELESFIHKSDLPAYRARQIIHWIYENYTQAIDNITEFQRTSVKDYLRKPISAISDY